MSATPTHTRSEETPEPPSSEPNEHNRIMGNLPMTRVQVANYGPTPISPLPTPYGIVEHYRPYDRAQRQQWYPRRAASTRGRRRWSTPPPTRPPSQMLTRHIPTPHNVFDTEDDDTDGVSPTNPPGNVTPTAPRPVRISADDTIGHLPFNLVRQLGLDSVDVELADRLIDTSPEYRWPLSVLLMVSAQQGPVRPMAPRHRPRPTAEPRADPETFAFEDSFNHSVHPPEWDLGLLQSPNAHHPNPIGQPPNALDVLNLAMLPPGYTSSDPSSIAHLQRLFKENITEEKARLRRTIMVKISPYYSAHGPIPNLDDLMAYVWHKQRPDPDLQPAPLEPPPPGRQVDRVRIAHTRLHMLNYKYGWPVPSSSNWTTFDRDLQALAGRDSIYRQAHANAILLRDTLLFNGLNTLASIPEPDRRLPNEREIDHQIMMIEVGATLLDIGEPELGREHEE
ncbi:uncharacterized protein PGTG_22474 [Puccinia graminis f. sp. tritici CRL 75-36-700-3]|uniref:Uncharacterized protein n=1 Tax=Puccinia graminis f. sp. tritici (strain CRL 75-36-700-3 / race SCCL) TaxID=418459 RepID=H6QUP3_PUCGT|nr:uncharacterized protein PGTG_22474 [Puccinia graminis f. sp. tritici CRL 75-36-700-3]EHS64755.1 hypothetical protein PGTG_22474 [Puccinia graminis f. sp. tritici CRL 75-36-700-3]